MGSVKVVRELVEHGADLNVTNAVSTIKTAKLHVSMCSCDYMQAGLTPLMIATNMKKTSVVKELLKSEAIDINLPHKVQTKLIMPLDFVIQ